MKQNLSEIISETAGGVWHGEGIDAIEYCRGQLAAFSYVSVTASREVHVLRLRNSFEWVKITPKLRYALSVISLMREAQELRGGYWFPTPLRAVPVGGHAILVGVTPTSELQRHFDGVSRAGYARVLPQQPGLGLPLQELDNWLGLIVPDSAVWAKNQLEDANASMGPTIAPANVQFFTVLSKPSSFGITIYPVWAESSRDALSGMYGIVLCRTRVGRESFRYCLGRVKGGRLVAEGITPKDTMRIQFGMAALAGRSISVNAEIDGNTTTFHIPANLQPIVRELPPNDQDLITLLRTYGVPGQRATALSEVSKAAMNAGLMVCVTGVASRLLVESWARTLGRSPVVFDATVGLIDTNTLTSLLGRTPSYDVLALLDANLSALDIYARQLSDLVLSRVARPDGEPQVAVLLALGDGVGSLPLPRTFECVSIVIDLEKQYQFPGASSLDELVASVNDPEEGILQKRLWKPAADRLRLQIEKLDPEARVRVLAVLATR